jgi:hypothetical protein
MVSMAIRKVVKPPVKKATNKMISKVVKPMAKSRLHATKTAVNKSTLKKPAINRTLQSSKYTWAKIAQVKKLVRIKATEPLLNVFTVLWVENDGTPLTETSDLLTALYVEGPTGRTFVGAAVFDDFGVAQFKGGNLRSFTLGNRIPTPMKLQKVTIAIFRIVDIENQNQRPLMPIRVAFNVRVDAISGNEAFVFVGERPPSFPPLPGA